MPNTTVFNTQKHHIHLAAFIPNKEGDTCKLRAILDTGAPFTEVSDQFLQHSGIIEPLNEDIKIKEGLETQKYHKIILPYIEVCSHKIENSTIYISRFQESWGIDALIGLDFLRKFQVTINYNKGEIITESLV